MEENWEDISFEGFLMFGVSVLKRAPFLFKCINLITFDDHIRRGVAYALGDNFIIKR